MADKYKESEVPKFSGQAKDWPLFKVELRVFLRRFGIDPTGTIDDTDAVAKRRKEGILAASMMAAIPKRWLVAHADQAGDGKAVYDSLCAKYEQRDIAGRHAARQELYGASLRNKCQAEPFIHDLLSLKGRYEACGGTISPEELTEILVNGLTPEYDTVKSALDDAPPGAPLSWDAATAMVLKRCARIQRDAGSVSGNTADRPKRTGKPKFGGTCHYCGKAGHRFGDCRKRARDLRTGSDTSAPLPAATSTTTMRTRGGMAGRGRGRGAGLGSSRPSRSTTCYRCGKAGHVSRYCTASVQQHHAFISTRAHVPAQYAPAPSGTVPGATTHHGQLVPQIVYVQQQPADTTTLFMLSATAIPDSDPTTWHLDTMASDTVSPHREAFEQYEEYDAEVRGVGVSRAIGRGVIRRMAVLKDGTRTTVAFNALHVPGITANILSEPAIRAAGHAVICDRDGARIDLVDGRQLPMDRVGIYMAIKLLAVTPHHMLPAAASHKAAATLELWHKRLAHANYRAVKAAASMCDGMDITNAKIPDGLCAPCMGGRMGRLPFSSDTRAADRPGELIYHDLAGPLPVVSRQGNRYKSIFVDGKTDYAFLYFLKTKSQDEEAMRRFLRDSKVDASTMTLRSDGGPEIKAAARSCGIDAHELTCPDTPQQNGVAEVRLDVNNCDCIAMLLESGLPDELWEDASLHANRCRNRLPCAGQSITRFEAWHGTRPRLDKLPVWGCTAYPLVAKSRRADKLAPHATPHAFIGFTHDHAGYVMLNPETFRTTVARHVRFDEYAPAGPLFGERESDDMDADYENAPPEPAASVEIPEEPVEESRPRRTRREPSEFWHVAHALAKQPHELGPEPKTYNEAMTGPEAPHWEVAIDRELDQMNGVWIVVPRGEATTQPIPTKWTFKRKLDGEGKLVSYKARLCACGNYQASDSYGETFAPVAPQHVTRIFTALAVQLGAEQYHIDIKGAYLEAPITEDVYVWPPKGLTVPPNSVCKLEKSLYGTHQANRNWVLYHRSGLQNAGYRTTFTESCIFTRHEGSNYLVSEVHTDDADVVTNSRAMLDHYVQTLGGIATVGSVTPISHFCGLSIKRDASSVTVHQAPFIEQKARELHLHETRHRSTPAECRYLLRGGSDDNVCDATRYRRLVGIAQWAANNTRPDISWAANQVARFSNKPSPEHRNAAVQVIQFLATNPRGIQYTAGASLRLEAYADADWGSDPTDRKPFLGWVVMMCGGPLLWRSRKAGGVATSTCEAEYMAASACAQDVLYVRQLLNELRLPGVDVGSPTPIYIDNRSAKSVAQMLANPPKLRHVAIRYHFIRDLVEKGEVALDWVAGANNPADILTKPLNASKFKQHAHRITVGIGGGRGASLPK